MNTLRLKISHPLHIHWQIADRADYFVSANGNEWWYIIERVIYRDEHKNYAVTEVDCSLFVHQKEAVYFGPNP